MRDRVARWIARCLPRRVVYWCGMRIISHAVTGKYGEHGKTRSARLSAYDAMDRWERDHA